MVAEKDKTDMLPLGPFGRQNVPVVLVDDTILALGKMGRYNRERSAAKVAAVTRVQRQDHHPVCFGGHAGHTLCHPDARAQLQHAIGLPLTLLRLGPKHEWAALEMGMNQPGEIRYLGQICRPDIGIITNVAPAHLEGLHTLDGVAAAKAELLDAVVPAAFWCSMPMTTG